MKLRDYIEQHGLQREPLGRILFGAIETKNVGANSEKNDLLLDADIVEALEIIGITEVDQDKAMMIQKIRFALRASDETIVKRHGLGEITEINEGDLTDMHEDGVFREEGDPIPLNEIQTEIGVRGLSQEDIRATDWDKRTALTIHKYVDGLKKDEVDEIRTGLKLILDWLTQDKEEIIEEGDDPEDEDIEVALPEGLNQFNNTGHMDWILDSLTQDVNYFNRHLAEIDKNLIHEAIKLLKSGGNELLRALINAAGVAEEKKHGTGYNADYFLNKFEEKLKQNP